jgi:DNA-binding phage protein
MRQQRYWTGAEKKRALQMANDGVRYADIAKVLGRTERSVKGFMGRLGRAGEYKLRAMPLAEADTSRAHPVIRRLFRVAARDGYTYEELAKRSGVSKPAIRDMARVGNPRLKNLLAVAQTLNVNLSATQMQDGGA